MNPRIFISKRGQCRPVGWLTTFFFGFLVVRVRPDEARERGGGPGSAHSRSHPSASRRGSRFKGMVPVKPNAFWEFSPKVVPEGHRENSPAFQRWVVRCRPPSPVGTAEAQARNPVFYRPFGTCFRFGPNPALKRWAIIGCPSGTRTPEFPKGIQVKRQTLTTGRWLGLDHFLRIIGSFAFAAR